MGVKRADALFDQLGPTVLKDIRLDQLDLSGKKVGIDATLWLGTVKSTLKANQKKLSSSTEKFLVKVQEKTHADHFIAYCEDRFKLLNRLKIKSMMVFDGNATPRKTEIKMLWKKIKEGSSKKKEVNIDPNPDSDIDHECDSDSDGDNDRDNERKKVNYNKPEKMYIPDRKRVLEWLTKEGVEFIVAPYEADAQLTYLTIKGKIDAVITEDSDLIAFGCPHVIYKLDVNTQMCKHYSFDRLKDHHLYGTFTKKMLLEMCIMIGCDYLPNLQGIGIQKAGDAIKESKTFANIIPYKKNIKLRIEADKFETNTPKILEEFKKAIKAFTYQQVYDPDSHTCERLSHINYAGLREDAAEILRPCLKDKSVHAIATGSRPSEIKEADIIKPNMDGVIIETKRRTNILISDFMPNYRRRHS